jgi:hypothetical protein
MTLLLNQNTKNEILNPFPFSEYSGLPSVWTYQEIDENASQNNNEKIVLTDSEIDKIIEVALVHSTPFKAIKM